MNTPEETSATLKRKVLFQLNGKEVPWETISHDEKPKRPKRCTPYPKATKKLKLSTNTQKILNFEDSEDEDKPSTSAWTVTECKNIKPDKRNKLINYNSTEYTSSEDDIGEKDVTDCISEVNEFADETDSDSNVKKIYHPRVGLKLKKCQIIKLQSPNNFQSPSKNHSQKNSENIENFNISIDLETDNHLENNSSIEKPKIRFSRLVRSFINENGCILFLKHPLNLYFHGKLSLSVLYGSVEILGHVLHFDGLKDFEIYSPRGQSYLCFETKESDFKDKDVLQNSLQDFKMPTKQIKEFLYRLGANDCVVLLKNLNNNLTNYLSAHVAQYLFPKPMQCEKRVEKKLHCLFETDEPAWKTYRTNENWLSCVKNSLYCLSSGFSCSILCGGKSVGKSTLLRYMINSLLNEVKQVVCIDLDPGQSEFTIGGCVSVIIIREPIFGPNFTHLKTPLKSYFIGDVNVLNCMERYLASVKELMRYCNLNIDKNSPWIVNSMGFTKSIGTDLMVSIIKYVCPTTVIQINSSIKNKNYPSDLSSDFVENYIYSFPVSPPKTKVKYNLITLESCSEEKVEGEFQFEARHLREMSILAYFSQMIEAGKEITSAAPYSVKLSSIKLKDVSYSEGNLLAVMNGNLVALCLEYGKNIDTFSCLGFGIIRGIDRGSEELYLLTPVAENELIKVNSLIRGCINLPPSLYMTTGRQGLVPYILLGTQQGTSEVPKRSYINLCTLFRKK